MLNPGWGYTYLIRIVYCCLKSFIISVKSRIWLYVVHIILNCKAIYVTRELTVPWRGGAPPPSNFFIKVYSIISYTNVLFEFMDSFHFWYFTIYRNFNWFSICLGAPIDLLGYHIYKYRIFFAQTCIWSQCYPWLHLCVQVALPFLVSAGTNISHCNWLISQ